VLPLTECKADVREYITCEEEERRRLGFEIETYFSVPDGDMSRVQRAVVRSGGDDLLNLAFIPAARLVQLNRRDRGRKDEGFPLGMNTGFWKSNNQDTPAKEEIRSVLIQTHSTADALYIEPVKSLGLARDGVLSLMYALKRAIENTFQIESSELGAQPMGGADTPNLFLYEASEGSLGVLSELANDKDAFQRVVAEAIRLCRFDDEKQTERATYDDLLSYYNQPHHLILDRFSIQDALNKMAACSIEVRTSQSGLSYDQQFERLMKEKDPNSSTEETFLKFLFKEGRRLPDEAQDCMCALTFSTHPIPGFSATERPMMKRESSPTTPPSGKPSATEATKSSSIITRTISPQSSPAIPTSLKKSADSCPQPSIDNPARSLESASETGSCSLPMTRRFS
jgi:hypothetical protein